MTSLPGGADPLADKVLAEIAGLLRTILNEHGPEEYGIVDAEIRMDSQFYRDLELESIDLVALGGLLRERYGDAVDFAEFIAALDLGQIIKLSVGELVEFVVAALRAAEED
jgi:acyl carrier protein